MATIYRRRMQDGRLGVAINYLNVARNVVRVNWLSAALLDRNLVKDAGQTSIYVPSYVVEGDMFKRTSEPTTTATKTTSTTTKSCSNPVPPLPLSRSVVIKVVNGCLHLMRVYCDLCLPPVNRENCS